MGYASEGNEGLRSRRLINSFGIAALALAIAAGGLAAAPQTAVAAGKKVVIVVGPVARVTPYFKSVGDDVAAVARSYGANVTKIYTPNATWARVKNAAQGANVLVYIGHGNGWPSPYKPFQTYTKDGMGLNATAGNGNSNVKYWGERYIARDIQLARNAAVILMRLCYATGNSEMGKPYPSKDVARQRVDNYGAGFLRTGAKVVFGEGLGGSSYIFKGLYKTSKSMREIFWSAGNATFRYRMAFGSSRTSWARAEMDPRWPGSYYRSIIGDLSMSAASWR